MKEWLKPDPSATGLPWATTKNCLILSAEAYLAALIGLGLHFLGLSEFTGIPLGIGGILAFMSLGLCAATIVKKRHSPGLLGTLGMDIAYIFFILAG